MQLLAHAKEEGASLIGPGRLLGGLTKTLLQSALEVEMTEHLVYERKDPRPAENVRNGRRPTTVIDLDRVGRDRGTADRDGSFEPQIVRNSQRCPDGIDEMTEWPNWPGPPGDLRRRDRREGS